MTPIRLYVIRSTTDPELLSVRMPDGGAWGSFQRALEASGAQPGMVLVLKEAVPEFAENCPMCGQQVQERNEP